MKHIYLTIALTFLLSSSSLASKLPHAYEMVSMAEHVIASWKSEEEHGADLLWEELAKQEPVDTIDIITKTCSLCQITDSSRIKASVALSLLVLNATGRDEVARYGSALRRHFVTAGKAIGIEEIVTTFAETPPYMRLPIFGILQSSNNPIETTLTQHVRILAESFTCLERGAMYFHYKTSGIFSSYTGPSAK